MQIFLATERLLLRRLTAADGEHLVALDSDPAVMHYITGGRATPRQEVEAEVLPRLLAYYDRFGGLGCWAAVEQASGQFVGWFALRPNPDSPPGEAELGYRLRRSALGRGYATEGAGALIDKGFTAFGLERVVATTMATWFGGVRGGKRGHG